MLKAVIILSLFGIVLVAGKGINCKGSSGCTSKNVLSQFSDYLGPIDGNTYYKSGQHIVCIKRGTGFLGWLNPRDGYCLFLQGVNGMVDGHQIRQLLSKLMEYGCEGCGSIPIGYPASNDPDNGILTSNYVANRDVACDGLC